VLSQTTRGHSLDRQETTSTHEKHHSISFLLPSNDIFFSKITVNLSARERGSPIESPFIFDSPEISAIQIIVRLSITEEMVAQCTFVLKKWIFHPVIAAFSARSFEGSLPFVHSFVTFVRSLLLAGQAVKPQHPAQAGSCHNIDWLRLEKPSAGKIHLRF
jgi:hypothetical protein